MIEIINQKGPWYYWECPECKHSGKSRGRLKAPQDCPNCGNETDQETVEKELTGFNEEGQEVRESVMVEKEPIMSRRDKAMSDYIDDILKFRKETLGIKDFNETVSKMKLADICPFCGGDASESNYWTCCGKCKDSNEAGGVMRTPFYLYKSEEDGLRLEFFTEPELERLGFTVFDPEEVIESQEDEKTLVKKIINFRKDQNIQMGKYFPMVSRSDLGKVCPVCGAENTLNLGCDPCISGMSVHCGKHVQGFVHRHLNRCGDRKNLELFSYSEIQMLGFRIIEDNAKTPVLCHHCGEKNSISPIADSFVCFACQELNKPPYNNNPEELKKHSEGEKKSFDEEIGIKVYDDCISPAGFRKLDNVTITRRVEGKQAECNIIFCKYHSFCKPFNCEKGINDTFCDNFERAEPPKRKYKPVKTETFFGCKPKKPLTIHQNPIDPATPIDPYAEFFRDVDKAIAHIREVLETKNSGYSKTGEGDPLINFRWRFEEGMATRLNDKINRLKSYVDNKENSMNKLMEIFRDITGYGIIGMVWTKQNGGEFDGQE